MPIVFCASFVPCESENRLPEMIWPSRKPRETGPGWRRPTIRYASEIAIAVTTSASTGATSAGTDDLLDDAAAEHGVGALGGEGGADDAADQRVRGGGRAGRSTRSRGSRRSPR